MPDTASLTLSSITWLKRKPTPGRSLTLRCMASTNPLTVVRGDPFLARLERHQHLGLVEAVHVRAVVRPAELRHHVRAPPGSEETISRARRVRAAASDGAIDSGSSTCTQSDPSSSLGRNSEPRKWKAVPAPTSASAASRQRRRCGRRARGRARGGRRARATAPAWARPALVASAAASSPAPGPRSARRRCPRAARTPASAPWAGRCAPRPAACVKSGTKAVEQDRLREQDRAAHVANRVDQGLGHAAARAVAARRTSRCSTITTARVDDDAEVDRAHGDQVGGHAAQVEEEEGAEQRQRDDRGDDQRGTPVAETEEQQEDDDDEADALEHVVRAPCGASRSISSVRS